MSELLQFIIVVAFGALCFGCGYLIGFIVTRNQWRDELIKRGVARYNSNGSGSRLCQWARARSAKSYNRDAVAYFRSARRHAPIVFQRSEAAPSLIRPPA